MGCINIISKEEIKVLPNWFLVTLLGISIAIVSISTVIAYIICKKKKKSLIKVVYTELIAGAVAIAYIVMSFLFAAPYILVPSGRFRYEAVIDKDHITVSEYEDFIEKYKPEIKGDTYYFETSDVLEEDV